MTIDVSVQPRPRPAVDKVSDSGRRHPKASSDHGLLFARLHETSNLPSLRLSEPRAWLLLAPTGSSVADFVAVVLCGRGPTQVTRVHAARDATRVRRLESAGRARPVPQGAREDVTVDVLLVHRHGRIPGRVSVRPQDALVGFKRHQTLEGVQALSRERSHHARVAVLPPSPIVGRAKAATSRRSLAAVHGTRTLCHCRTSLGSGRSRGRRNAARLTHSTSRASL